MNPREQLEMAKLVAYVVITAFLTVTILGIAEVTGWMVNPWLAILVSLLLAGFLLD